MYPETKQSNGLSPQKTPMPKHLEVAHQMGNEFENFSPAEQFEMLQSLKSRTRENMANRMDVLMKEASARREEAEFIKQLINEM